MLYTPERLKLYKRAGEAFEAVSALGAALVSHEGSFLEATDDQFEAAVPTELAAFMDASAGARLLHKLALCRRPWPRLALGCHSDPARTAVADPAGGRSVAADSPAFLPPNRRVSCQHACPPAARQGPGRRRAGRSVPDVL